MVLHRIALPFFHACFITVCLLYLMFSLVDVGEPSLLAKAKTLDIGWVRIPPDDDPNLIDTKLEPPIEPEPRPELKRDETVIDVAEIKQTPWREPEISVVENDALYMGDSQLVLALGYPPAYPQAQANRGVEGYVVVGFSVSASGHVYDPFIIESEPKGVFDRSALKAIAKFKYKARVVNEKPVSTDGQRYLFRYQLD